MVESMLVEDHNGLVDREAVRAAVREALSPAVDPQTRAAQARAQLLTGPAAVAAQDAWEA